MKTWWLTLILLWCGPLCAQVPTPYISFIQPNNGPLSGGNTVTITGLNFGTPTVTVNGLYTAYIYSNSATLISFEAPAVPLAGIYPVVENNGSNSNKVYYKYNAGPTATLTLTETNTVTSTFTNTPVNTHTMTNTATNTTTNTATNTATNTTTNTATNTPTNTATNTATNTPTNTATNTATQTSTWTIVTLPGNANNSWNSPYGPPTPGNTYTPIPSGGPTLQIVHKFLAANVVTAVVTANVVYVSGSTANITPTPGDYVVFGGGTTIGGYPLAIGTVTAGNAYSLIPATYIPTIQAGALAGVTLVMWISGSRSIPAYVSSTSNLTNAVSVFQQNMTGASTHNDFQFFNAQTDANYYQCGNGVGFVGVLSGIGDYPITQTTTSAAITYLNSSTGGTANPSVLVDTWQLWGTR